MSRHARIACFGAAHVDVTLKGPHYLVPGTSNPVDREVRFGGVACNVARNLARLDHQVALISRIGSDDEGDGILHNLAACGVDASLVARSTTSTGRYIATLNPDGSLFAGFAALDIYDEMSAAWLHACARACAFADIWFADANLPHECLHVLASWQDRPTLVLDAVSVPKAVKLVPFLGQTDLLVCNRDEAEEIGRYGGVPATSIITDGDQGCTLVVGPETHNYRAQKTDVVSVNGAGDAFVAGVIHAMAQKNHWHVLPECGIAAATIALASLESSPPDLTRDHPDLRPFLE